jgi:hypothetical protein
LPNEGSPNGDVLPNGTVRLMGHFTEWDISPNGTFHRMTFYIL